MDIFFSLSSPFVSATVVLLRFGVCLHLTPFLSLSLVSSPSCLRLAFLIVFLWLVHRENEEEYRRRRRRKKKTSSRRYTPSSIDAVRRHCRIIIGKGFSLSLFFLLLSCVYISIFDFFYLLSSSSLILFHC